MLSEIIAGPILRRLTEQQLVIWWVSPFECKGHLHCYIDNNVVFETALAESVTCYRVGERAVVHLLDVQISLPSDTYIEYDLLFNSEGHDKKLSEMTDGLMYNGRSRPSFIIQPTINNLLHGSCRNPHYEGHDSLLAGDDLTARTLDCATKRPALLMMSGDQIYADHVAGPMLFAIHQVIELLGLNSEELAGEQFTNSDQLYQLSDHYYQRESLLPKGVFTSTSSHNHLMTFAEFMAMYLLVWSPTLWQEVELQGFAVADEHKAEYQRELIAIEKFQRGLSKVRRLLAHTPTYMIFDDHDVTDDWNLTAHWEQEAYQHPLSKQVIGNALMSYWLCQGWGNDPAKFTGDFWQVADAYQCNHDIQNQHNFIDYLYEFSHWHYSVESSPKLVVLDSRTRRWRSERNLKSPSGLMDWEAMCELQQELIGQQAIILVSPAPIFGVKVIETMQRVMTTLGHPLAVDAENWMAHKGSASTMLNIFKHPKTPQNFVILSGDVHYSFVYDIELRFRHFSPEIWQITSSGIKNQFPQPWIGLLDTLNRWLYGSYSPLNLFTQRRSMKIKGRHVAGQGSKRLMDRCGLGYVELDSLGKPVHICDLHNDGSNSEFLSNDEELLP